MEERIQPGGGDIKVVEFYRANQKPFGVFSNLYRRPVMFEGLEFASAEHAYQAGKARSESVRAWLLSAPSPALVAMASHGLYSWEVAPNWAKIKYDRMRAVLRAKFTQHSDLREVLLSTGSARLVEAATVDNEVNREWGTVKRRGQNMLGVLLMETREELRVRFRSACAALSTDEPQGRLAALQHEANECLKFCTIGYGGLSPSDFQGTLKRRGVRSVVDIRIWPTRASMGCYTLARSPEKGIRGLLSSAGIAYHSLLELGNPFRDLPDWRERYSGLVESAGNVLLERLIRVAGPSCLLCAEKDPQECHRTILADFLRKRGYEVEHLAS